jgi:hypothetical protein
MEPNAVVGSLGSREFDLIQFDKNKTAETATAFHWKEE